MESLRACSPEKLPDEAPRTEHYQVLHTEEGGAGHQVKLQNRRDLRENLDPPSCLLDKNRDTEAGRVTSLGHNSGLGVIISTWKALGMALSRSGPMTKSARCDSAPLSSADGEEGGDSHPDL